MHSFIRGANHCQKSRKLFFEMIIEMTKKSLRNHRNHSEIRGITEQIFYIKIAYFVRERIELFIGIYIPMKSTFLFKPESSEKMVKTSKFVSQKQNKKIDVKQ